MFETVEQIVFLAACRVHFDRIVGFGRAAVVFDVGSFSVHPGIVPHDKDLHELAGFEAIGIAIAATGVCFMQRVGRCCLCGIHHAEVWHRRQQHRKRKQHCEQLLFESSSCFHVSSCFLLQIFYLKEKSARTMSYASFVKGLLGRASPVHFFGCQGFFRQPCANLIFFSRNEKAASCEAALFRIFFYQSMKPL